MKKRFAAILLTGLILTLPHPAVAALNMMEEGCNLALKEATEITLYSLTPAKNSAEQINGFSVLGKTVLKGDARKQAEDIVRTANLHGAGDTKEGFEPEYALRVLRGKDTFDFVVSLASGKMRIFIDGTKVDEIQIKGQPDELNAILTSAKVHLPKSPGEKAKSK